MCSLAGKQRILKSQALVDRFRAAASGDDVAALAQEFVKDVASNRCASHAMLPQICELSGYSC